MLPSRADRGIHVKPRISMRPPSDDNLTWESTIKFKLIHIRIGQLLAMKFH